MKRRLDVIQRPQTRGDCIDGPRPCPFAGCRHHLFLDVHPRSGNIKYNADDLFDMAETCALDVADRGPTHLRNAGSLINVTHQAIRQIEQKAKKTFRKRARIRRLDD